MRSFFQKRLVMMGLPGYNSSGVDRVRAVLLRPLNLIGILVLMLIINESMAVPGMCNIYTPFTLNGGGTINNCTQCVSPSNGGWKPYKSVRVLAPGGIIVDLNQCAYDRCSVNSTLILFANPANDILGYYNCTSCPSGSSPVYMNIVDGQSIYQCLDCGVSCSICKNSTHCISCKSAFFSHATLPYICSSCASTYGNLCATCNATQCLTCSTGRVFNTSVSKSTFGCCIRCTVMTIPNCGLCVDGPACARCNANYFNNFTATSLLQKCIRCTIPNCATCTDGVVCATCLSSRYKNFSKATHQCVACSALPNCLTCSDGPTCTQCIANTYFDQTTPSNGCVYCSVLSNCLSCIDGPICTSCASGFGLDLLNTSNGCISCLLGNCATCVDGPNCTNCQTGYFPNNSTVSPKPLCLPCSTIPNCLTCVTSQPLCLTCVSGFFMDFSTATHECVSCTIPHCLTCADGPICTSCQEYYIADANNGRKSCILITCLSDEYFNNTCLKCSSQDIKCKSCHYMTSSINCTLCQTQWIPDPSTWFCVKCQSLINNCSTCSDIQNCTQCKYPYKLGPTAKCDSCQAPLEWFEGRCIIKGCRNSHPDSSKCLSCLNVYNFFFNPLNNTCACERGYISQKINQISQCVSNCGNKITIFPYEQCDDGNLRDGDGCDKTCKIQNGFTCILTQPTQCTLNLNVTQLRYNYAYRIQGANRCRFSFSVFPMHSVFTLVDWSKYLSLNISADFFIPESVNWKYISATNQITVELDYRDSLESMIVKATLSFTNQKTQSVQASLQISEQVKKVSVGSFATYPQPSIFSIPSELSVEIKIKGLNSILLFEDEGILAAYKVASIGFLIIAVIALLFFIIAAYFHKMIGLETIQILQFHYFLTMIVEQKKTIFLKSLNVLMYTSFGGYSNYKLFYTDVSEETVSLASAEIHQNFRFVGLSKYFTLNVNFPLILPTLALIAYTVFMVIKIKKRLDYMHSEDQLEKDLYTGKKRTAQWVYDHCVFPFVSLFAMIAFFCTILELMNSSSSDSDETKDISSLHDSSGLTHVEKTSFIPNMILLFVTFFMFSYEVFISYEQYRRSKMTEDEKARIPLSIIEKLEHDENNPDRENYKPGYILIYLLFYFTVQTLLMVNVLITEISEYGLDLMLGLCFVYLIIVWYWNPYHETANFHNRALKLNHFTAFFFVLACELFTRVQLSASAFVILIYISLFLLSLVSCCAFARLYVEYQFRKKLEDDPKMMEEKKEIRIETDRGLLKMTRRERLMLHNKYTIESQFKEMWKERSVPLQEYPLREEDQIQFIRNEMRKDLHSKRRHQLENKDDFKLDKNIPNNKTLKSSVGINRNLIDNVGRNRALINQIEPTSKKNFIFQLT